MWEWGWELEASLGTILWDKQLIVLRVKSWVLRMFNHDWNLVMMSMCLMFMSCPNFFILNRRSARANVGLQGPLRPSSFYASVGKREGAPLHYQPHPSRQMPSGNSRLVYTTHLATLAIALLLPVLLLLKYYTTAKWDKRVKKKKKHPSSLHLAEFHANRHVH